MTFNLTSIVKPNSSYSSIYNIIDSKLAFVSCNTKNGMIPSLNPRIEYLSVDNSKAKYYTMVYITGTNFLPPSIGSTYINFGDYKNIPIIFFNTTSIAFIVPQTATFGKYNINVVNVNNVFSKSSNNSYPGSLLTSNTFTYTIN